MPASVRAQNVDYLSADGASYLAGSGIDVLVPSWVPAPFAGFAPDLSASGGSYSLYWMVAGGAPTFLQITGTAGGAMPQGSPANLNVPLTVNSNVQGYDAIHDVGVPEGSDTAIYDQVWWQAGGVLYNVSSNNMTGSDTMSLANSLISLSAPVYEEPTEVPVEVPTDVPVEVPTDAPVDAPVDVPTDAPVESDTTTDTASDTDTTSTDTTTSDSSDAPDTSTDTSSDTTTTDSSSTDSEWSPGKYSGDTPSDGTSGAKPPVFGGDGTGGTQDNSVPRRPAGSVPQE